MAGITIDIKTEKKAEAVDLLCKRYGYETEIYNVNYDPDQEESAENPKMIPNTQTKNQFVKQRLAEHVKREVKSQLEADRRDANMGEMDVYEIS
jgi:hypothetical protein